jgi:hypothetical protein
VATEPDPDVCLVLVPSTLLGPSVWAPVGTLLERRGWTVQVPGSPGEVDGPEHVLEHLLTAIPADRPVVLVPHSNSGLYVATLAVERDVRGVVFVDSRLPSSEPSTPTASPEFRAYLAGLADEDGRLPVWTEWWPGEDLGELFPDTGTRALVEAEQARLPLAYFDAAVPTPSGWEGLPAAYVAFGEGAYEEEVSEAQWRGWPVQRLDGGHLHQLVDPDGVAALLVGLVRQMGF